MEPQVLNESSIAALIAAGTAIAHPPKHHDPDVPPYVILPDGFKIEQLERVDKPSRKKGAVTFKDVPSFAHYFPNHGNKETHIYATMNPAKFIAVFNDHNADAAGHRDHRAILELAHSKEYLAWTNHNGKGAAFAGNVAFAEWLEDQAPDLTNPKPADMLSIALNFKVNEGVTFASAARLENGQVAFNLATTVEGAAQNAAGRKVSIPEQFSIEIPIFEGPDAKKYQIDARFRYRINGGALTIWYEMIRPDKVVEKAFKDVWSSIEKETKTKVLFGSP